VPVIPSRILTASPPAASLLSATIYFELLTKSGARLSATIAERQSSASQTSGEPDGGVGDHGQKRG